MASAIDQLDPQQTVAEVGASRSLWQLAWRRFRKNRLGLISAVILVVLYLLAMFAEFLGPYYFDEFHGTRVFAPPQTVHLLTEEGRITRPFTYAYTMELNMTTLARTYTEDRSKRYPIRFFVKGRPYRMFWIFELDRRLLGFDEGGSLFLLGTDSLGRDLLSRILKGAQVSLSVPLIGTLITIILGSVLGVASGYFGGLIDNVIQRFIEVILSFPRIPLWLALSAAVPKTWPSSYVYLSVVVILSLIGWGGLARVVRGKVLAYRGEEYVLAAQSVGASSWRIITRHLTPGSLSHIIVVATLGIPGLILGESALSFLGVGITPPMTSWGVLIKDAQHINAIVNNPHLMIPGFMIILAVLCFNFLGDAMRDAADPFST